MKYKDLKSHFTALEAPLLLARSLRGLMFGRDIIESTKAFLFFHWNQEAMLLEACKEVVLEENRTKGQLVFKTITLGKMDHLELRGHFRCSDSRKVSSH